MSDAPRYYCLAPRPWVVDAPAWTETVELAEGDTYEVHHPEQGHWGLPPGTLGSVDLAPIGSQQYVFAASDQPFNAEDVAAKIGDGARLQAYVPGSSERQAWTALLDVAWTPGWTLLDALWAVLTVQSDPDGELRAKPLVPTHRGVLELHLGGHSLIRSARMPAKATDLPHWPQLQRVLQNDYRRIHGHAMREAGRWRGLDRRSEPTLHRKWLGAMASKYRLPAEAARDLLIPQGLPRELPLPPTTEIRDDFNRSDRNLGSDEATVGGVAQGWEWEQQLGVVEIAGNQIRRGDPQAGDRAIRAGAPLSSDDHYAELTQAVRDTDYGAPCVRFAPNEATYYWIRQTQSSGVRIVRTVNGGHTNATSPLDIMGAPTRYRMVADGSTITAFAEGVQFAQVTDTAISGHLHAGAAVRGVGDRADDFFAADLLPEPARRSSPFVSPVFQSPVFGGGVMR